MTDEEFIELAYEIAFGDSAIHKDYSHEEVISRLREFSDNSDVWLSLKIQLKKYLIVADSYDEWREDKWN